jgi:hypothetical protein
LSGAAVRIGMNGLPAFLYFVFRSRFSFKLSDDERRFLHGFALIALAETRFSVSHRVLDP